VICEGFFFDIVAREESGHFFFDAAFNADELLVEFRRTLGARADRGAAGGWIS